MRSQSLLLTMLLVCALLLSACGRDDTAQVKEQGVPTSIQLTSSAFADGQPIPARFTCTGDDLSPPLAWSGAPETAQSFALIMDDPDAPGGTWVHWVVYNLPASTASLPEAVQPDEQLAGGGLHGKNSWKKTGYGGPCPPSGTHHYVFRLYALDALLELDAGATEKDLAGPMEGHILARGQLVGTYQKP
jgi:Raf kinase inhibitor-like YbhB/YbcL family protein